MTSLRFIFQEKPFGPNYRISGTCVLREEGEKQCFSDFAAHGIHLTSLLKCTVGILTSSQITLKLPGHGHALVARSSYHLKHGKINGRKFLPSCMYLPLNPLATTHFWESMGLFLIPGRLPSLRVEENLFVAVQVKVLSNQVEFLLCIGTIPKIITYLFILFSWIIIQSYQGHGCLE